MLLERGGTLDLVIAVPYTDILSVSCAQSQFLGPLCLWQRLYLTVGNISLDVLGPPCAFQKYSIKRFDKIFLAW